MNLTSVTTYVRLGLTGAITTLAAMSAYYPHATWIQATIIAASTIGIHVVPSTQQSKQSPPSA